MTTIQFGLFIAAVLIGFGLIYLQLLRFQTHLRDVSALKGVNDRLQGVSDALARMNLTNVEERLELILNQLSQLGGSCKRLERAVEQSRELAAPAGAAAESPAERIRALVETRLFSLGYRRLRLLTDLSSAKIADEVEVVVECEKNQMTHKGKVVACNGEIRDVSLQSVTQAFP